MWRSFSIAIMVGALATISLAQETPTTDASVALVELEVTIVEWRGSKPKLDDIDLAALEKSGELRVIERVRLTTVAGKQALYQRGQNVPLVTGAAATARGGLQRSINYQQVGTMVAVTPNVQAGKVVVETTVERSAISSDDGPVISEGEGGEKTRASGMVTGRAQTTVSLSEGKAVVIGGLTRTSSDASHGEAILMSAKVVK